MTGRTRSRLAAVLWVAFVAVVAADAIMLLRACGLLMPLAAALPESGWDFCPTTPAALGRSRAQRVLTRLARRFERELRRTRLACASIPPPPPSLLELPTHAGRPRPQQTALPAAAASSAAPSQ